ncbi:MAG: MtnX-like HAD-IB family phosphatase [Candidatus Omnitrophica bacterium]|nr:MtnX-like HAD-IB family phosphatase [Candidatus Omnitrophota bacterium]
MKKIVIISDFDGTITKKDSLVQILDRFAGPAWRDIARLIRNGRLGTRIGLKREFALCRVTKKQFVEFILENTALDPAFKDFLEFCKRNRIAFLVVSGGFTLNIETVFNKFGITGVPYYANRVTFNGDRVRLRFPYKDKRCKACSLCKAPYIRKFKKRGYFTVYIGDSVTDRCPGKIADLVFAKLGLAEYCAAKGINYIPYNTFGRVKKIISGYLKEP